MSTLAASACVCSGSECFFRVSSKCVGPNTSPTRQPRSTQDAVVGLRAIGPRSHCFTASTAPRVPRASRGVPLACQALLTVKDPATGIEFPLVQEFWHGSTYRSMGVGARIKKIAFVGVKVYAVSLYVEADKAARELGVRKRGGFFDDDQDDDFAQALVDGAFNKVLQIVMARKVEGAEFAAALQKHLEPRMRLMGDMSSLEKFQQFFQGQNIDKGSCVTLLWRQPDSLEVLLAERRQDCATATPGLQLTSPGLCRALFEVFLGSNSVVVEARKEWAGGARQLLDSEEVRRQTRKSGSG